MGKYAALLEEPVAIPPRGRGKYAALLDEDPIANPGNTKPEVSRIPDNVSPGEMVMRGLMPRSFKAADEGAGVLRTSVAGGLDALSAPGRILGSSNVKDSNTRMMPLGLGGAMIPVQPDAVSGHQTTAEDRAQMEAMADTQGKGLGQRILRDPALLPSMALGGPLLRGAGTVLKPIVSNALRRLAVAGLAGAGEGVLNAGIHQGDNAVEGRPVDLKQAGTEVALNTVVPVAFEGAGQLAKGAVSGLGALLKNHGEKITTNTIRPSLTDMKDGFRVANVYKHGLEGTLEQTAEKLDTKFADLTDQLNSKINASDAKIDLLNVLDDGLKGMGGDKASQFGKNSQMDKAADFILNEINEIAPDGVVDLATAQKVKRGLGKIGAWEWGKGDPESNAREALANAVYSKLKKAIEDVAPEGVKEINQQISELIPIEKAVVRRLPVEARNSAMSLTDMLNGGSGLVTGTIAGGPIAGALGALGGIALNRARKSPTLSAAGYKLGEVMQRMQLPSLPGLNPLSQRLIGADARRPGDTAR